MRCGTPHLLRQPATSFSVIGGEFSDLCKCDLVAVLLYVGTIWDVA
jgi:hypothetical protein